MCFKLLFLVHFSMQMNKLLFLDNESNIEVGMYAQGIDVNFKHNVGGYIAVAFGDDKRELF